MGEEPKLVAVADAGPLIHLQEVGRLALLAGFERVYVPDAVWSEAVVRGTVPEDELLSTGVPFRRQTVAVEAVDDIARRCGATNL